MTIRGRAERSVAYAEVHVFRKMSEIMKELAVANLRDAHAIPSSEAAHTALLLAHVGWNRSLGRVMRGYEKGIEAFTHSRPDLWAELSSSDPEALIEKTRQLKERRYPEDRRVVLVCGMRDETVYVEWCEEEDWPTAVEQVRARLGPQALIVDTSVG